VSEALTLGICVGVLPQNQPIQRNPGGFENDSERVITLRKACVAQMNGRNGIRAAGIWDGHGHGKIGPVNFEVNGCSRGGRTSIRGESVTSGREPNVGVLNPLSRGGGFQHTNRRRNTADQSGKAASSRAGQEASVPVAARTNERWKKRQRAAALHDASRGTERLQNAARSYRAVGALPLRNAANFCNQALL